MFYFVFFIMYHDWLMPNKWSRDQRMRTWWEINYYWRKEAVLYTHLYIFVYLYIYTLDMWFKYVDKYKNEILKIR